ncbi:hypothetical protein TNCV_4929671 [Trichonephila clavipes]|nr:hypothetical protein TNCV_4929671 [Trichonephila clavipes]
MICIHVPPFNVFPALHPVVRQRKIDICTNELGEKTAGRGSPIKMSCEADSAVGLLGGLSVDLIDEGSARFTRAFGDGPRNFEPWSSDDDDTSAGTPPHHTNGRSFESRYIQCALAPLHCASSVVSGSES